ncbi:hypothetical protein CBR_g16069 [Chara braunii]|uniref:Uncharacterized protein n=1 Tax=Chara braunii TaxID=69332 RepID=A0A388JT59_CHABU|nr:hypothetical protein CBR_g16069 [Chara braunii]|eukprot:GBG60947.1 hypothetical protein CBR_g16069 [Chara braunii]
MTFKPWLPLQELKEIRLQEAETRFWIMALRVPLDAYYYLHSVVQGMFGEVRTMHPPEFDSSRPKLMNIKFDMAPEAREKLDDDLTIQAPSGERWKVDIATPYTDWCKKCRWYFHTEDNCPRVRQGEGVGFSGRRIGGHKVRYSQHQQRQVRQTGGTQVIEERPTVSRTDLHQGPGPSANHRDTIATQGHNPRWADQVAVECFTRAEQGIRGGTGPLYGVSGAAGGDRSPGPQGSNPRWMGAAAEVSWRQPSQSQPSSQMFFGRYEASNDPGPEEGMPGGRGYNHHLFEHTEGMQGLHGIPQWRERPDCQTGQRSNWHAGEQFDERERLAAGSMHWREERWGTDTHDARLQGVEQFHQDQFEWRAPAHPLPRYPSNQYNWREFVPQGRDAHPMTSGLSWRPDGPGPSRLGRRVPSGDWRDQGREGGSGGREERNWRTWGRLEERGRNEDRVGEGRSHQGGNSQARSGLPRGAGGERNRIPEGDEGADKPRGELSKTSASSQSRVRWGSEWYEDEQALMPIKYRRRRKAWGWGWTSSCVIKEQTCYKTLKRRR